MQFVLWNQTIAVRLAPRKPTEDGTCAPERDIWLRLVGLDPVRRKGLFVCDRCSVTMASRQNPDAVSRHG